MSSEPVRIGTIDLDTSHAAVFAQLLHGGDRCRIAAVWDSGDIHPPGYAQQFADEHQIAQVCQNYEEITELVDAVMIHGVRWETHIDKAEGFITAGLPVLIDKPIVGSVAEAQRLLTLCNDHNARITGGSSLRFAKEIIELKDRGDDLGEVVTAYASGPGDFFSYGIHTHEMAAGVLGSGAKSVSYLGENRGVELFQVDYRSGAVLMMELHAPVHTWHFTATTTTGVHHTPIDASTLYQGLLDQFVALIEGQTPRATVDDLIESVLVMIAAQKSRRYRTAIFLEDLEMEDGFDGGVYTEEYRRLKYPDGWT